MVTSTRIRLDDFLQMPRIEEDRLELIDGEVYAKAMPTWGHGNLALVLGAAMNAVGFAAVEARAIVEAFGTFAASAPLPDVAYFREDPPAADDWMRRPPHVAVEILSPGQSRVEMRTKVQLYLGFGVESVWVVDPERRTVDVYEGGARRTLGDGDVLSSPSAPGFRIGLTELFTRP